MQLAYHLTPKLSNKYCVVSIFTSDRFSCTESLLHTNPELPTTCWCPQLTSHLCYHIVSPVTTHKMKAIAHITLSCLLHPLDITLKHTSKLMICTEIYI